MTLCNIDEDHCRIPSYEIFKNFKRSSKIKLKFQRRRAFGGVNSFQPLVARLKCIEALENFRLT